MNLYEIKTESVIPCKTEIQCLFDFDRIPDGDYKDRLWKIMHICWTCCSRHVGLPVTFERWLIEFDMDTLVYCFGTCDEIPCPWELEITMLTNG